MRASPSPCSSASRWTAANASSSAPSENQLHGRLTFGTGNRIAVVGGCEGFFTDLWVGTETLDGHLDGIRRVPVADLPEGQTLATFSVSWSADGSSLLAAVNSLDGGSGRVVAIDPDSGAFTTLFDAGATHGVAQVAQLADGSYVVAADGNVSIRDAQGTVQSEVRAQSFEAAIDLQR